MSNVERFKCAGNSFTDSQKDVIFKKTTGRCTYCGTYLERAAHGKCDACPPNGAWEIDHWLPESAGGPIDVSNLWPACCDCNDKKGTDDGELYILRRVFENKPINSGIVWRIVDEGPGRGRTGPRNTP